AETVAVDEPVVDDVTSVVEESRAVSGRRFGRRHTPEPKPAIAAVDEVPESLVSEASAVDDLAVGAVVEDAVLDGVVVAEVVDEIVIDASVVDVVEVAVVESLLTSVVEEPRVRRGRRFGRRRAPQSEPVIAAVDEVVESAVAEETVVDELIVDVVVEEPVTEA